jgi:hypothetical protein
VDSVLLSQRLIEARFHCKKSLIACYGEFYGRGNANHRYCDRITVHCDLAPAYHSGACIKAFEKATLLIEVMQVKEFIAACIVTVDSMRGENFN